MYIFAEAAHTMVIPKKVKTLKEGRIRADVVVQTGGDINRNRRRYATQLLKDGVLTIQPRIKEGSFLGELDHPIDKDPVRQVTVLYKESAHQFCEMGWDGNKLIAVIETLRTPNGKILRDLAEDGIPVGFSFRGMGDLQQITENKRQVYEVIGPLHVVTWDAVSYPSHAEAKLIKITESVTRMIHESTGVCENEGMVCTNEGYCYFPNDFDRLVEQRIIKLKEKFTL
jgi:hypothetical protein